MERDKSKVLSAQPCFLRQSIPDLREVSKGTLHVPTVPFEALASVLNRQSRLLSELDQERTLVLGLKSHITHQSHWPIHEMNEEKDAPQTPRWDPPVIGLTN